MEIDCNSPGKQWDLTISHEFKWIAIIRKILANNYAISNRFQMPIWNHDNLIAIIN